MANDIRSWFSRLFSRKMDTPDMVASHIKEVTMQEQKGLMIGCGFLPAKEVMKQVYLACRKDDPAAWIVAWDRAHLSGRISPEQAKSLYMKHAIEQKWPVPGDLGSPGIYHKSQYPLGCVSRINVASEVKPGAADYGPLSDGRREEQDPG